MTGNGQTELLEALSGIRNVESGNIELFGEKISDKDNFLNPRMLKDKGLAHVPEDRQRMGLVTDFKASENLIFGYHDQEPYSKSSILNNKEIADYSTRIFKKNLRNWPVYEAIISTVCLLYTSDAADE